MGLLLALVESFGLCRCVSGATSRTEPNTFVQILCFRIPGKTVVMKSCESLIRNIWWQKYVFVKSQNPQSISFPFKGGEKAGEKLVTFSHTKPSRSLKANMERNCLNNMSYAWENLVEKSRIRATLNPLLYVCDSRVPILYHESKSIPWVLSVPWLNIYIMSPCQYHESMFIPWVHVYTYRESMPIP